MEEEENRKLSSPIVNRDLENQNKHKKDAGTVRYSPKTRLMWEDMVAGSR